ncbi:uncharacterized protein [Typha latifolia]|uniref:uncharacterized protein n=1 Tax=Typha latifolia TaxID=4733 RepID=UPI003C2B269A
MEITTTTNCLYLVGLLLFASITAPEKADGAGECGKIPADRMALRMAPCAAASQNARAPVSSGCCSAVQKLGKSPRCLCAVMLSDAARKAGTTPAVAITIPKRCNIAKRPIGYKCGGYTLP